LYPNTICARNVSGNVIRCSCHSNREDIPDLGYLTCDGRGSLVNVLQPIINARDEIKAAIRREKERDTPDGDYSGSEAKAHRL
jgi:DNA polymerase I